MDVYKSGIIVHIFVRSFRLVRLVTAVVNDASYY